MSQRLLLGLCRIVGTPWCVLAFAALAVIGFPIHNLTPVAVVAWISQAFIQLVMLAVLQFAANQAQSSRNELHDKVDAVMDHHGIDQP